MSDEMGDTTPRRGRYPTYDFGSLKPGDYLVLDSYDQMRSAFSAALRWAKVYKKVGYRFGARKVDGECRLYLRGIEKQNDTKT